MPKPTKPEFFKSKNAGNIPLPLFFPDATKAFVRTVDSTDIENTETPGILVNTYHLFTHPGKRIIKKFGGVSQFMNWNGGTISDSGGFQIMTLAKQAGKSNGKITDKGVMFKLIGQKKVFLTPEDSIDFQFSLGTDLMVVLDDFTPPQASYDEAKETVERTILWAMRCREEFDRLVETKKMTEGEKPYLIGVAQGGKYQDLRKYCTEKLVEIGFDGIGYGGWPLRQAQGKLLMEFDYESAQTIKDNVPDSYLLYGLGIGKPKEVVALTNMGYHIFDCVLPTRDARHKRLYVYTAEKMSEINVNQENFYRYFVPSKEKNYDDESPVSTACDCLLCKNYSRAYLAHLFRENEMSALRLSTIHNLRFYSILMEKLRR